MTCPVCKRSTEARWRPFCSKRCADVDLGRWITGGYAIPTEEAPSGDSPEENRDHHDTPPDRRH